MKLKYVTAVALCALPLMAYPQEQKIDPQAVQGMNESCDASVLAVSREARAREAQLRAGAAGEITKLQKRVDELEAKLKEKK